MKTSLSSAAAVLVALFVCATVPACSDDDHDHEGDHDHDDHGAEPASCEAFHEACAAKASTNAKAKECDDFVHVEGRTEADCAAKKDECTAACQ